MGDPVSLSGAYAAVSISEKTTSARSMACLRYGGGIGGVGVTTLGERPAAWRLPGKCQARVAGGAWRTICVKYEGYKR